MTPEQMTADIETVANDPDLAAAVISELLFSVASHQSYTDIPVADVWESHLERAVEEVEKENNKSDL
ncbi:hypothetical protein [Nitrospira sp. BLG_1]|uniref:hypothetical protein n=1 Tax=Nitrospira sp. BLG_1 TaxID=3395883 RepID=UPI0039BC8A44